MCDDSPAMVPSAMLEDVPRGTAIIGTGMMDCPLTTKSVAIMLD